MPSRTSYYVFRNKGETDDQAIARKAQARGIAATLLIVIRFVPAENGKPGADYAPAGPLCRDDERPKASHRRP